MGLTKLQPCYQIIAEDKDITEAIKENLISLNLTDNEGMRSDNLQITLNDNNYALPKAGVLLKVSLGYDKKLTPMGSYIVSDLQLSGPPDKLTINANAASMSANSQFGKLQSQKSRTWGSLSIKDLVQTIASENGLGASVSSDFASIILPHLTQNEESDINLLTRISREYNGLLKPTDGRLVLTKDGKGQTISGSNFGGFSLTPAKISHWQVSISDRKPYGTVITRWKDLDTGTEKTEKIGQGQPVYRSTHTQSSAQEAKHQGEAIYNRSRQGTRTLSLSCPGNPQLIASAKLNMTGFRQDINGDWIISSVTHTLSSQGYSCSVQAKKM